MSRMGIAGPSNFSQSILSFDPSTLAMFARVLKSIIPIFFQQW